MKNILVIDNDDAILEVMREALDYEGYHVTAVTEADDICKLVSETNPDLVIIDYILNGINGGELCSHMKSNATTAGLPVILFSAYPKVFLSLGNYGCNAFIAKPFDLSTLVGQINTLAFPEISH